MRFCTRLRCARRGSAAWFVLRDSGLNAKAAIGSIGAPASERRVAGCGACIERSVVGTRFPNRRAEIAPLGPGYAPAFSAAGSRIEGSSLSGEFTRVEIGHIF